MIMAKKRKQQQRQQQQHSTNDDAEIIVVVLPGDDVTKHIIIDQEKKDGDGDIIPQPVGDKAKLPPKLGTGLRYDGGGGGNTRIYATIAGRLEKHRNKPVWFVKENLRRYRPFQEDRVIGIVEDRIGSDGNGGDAYRVNINASHPATLSNLSFEGATKRNKPSLQPGQLLYARVMKINDGQYLDPLLSCQLGPHDGGIPRKDWMTNEGCYGELKGGTVCRISTGLARELLKPNNLVLSEIANNNTGGSKIAFEIAVGVNGYLWVHSSRPEYTVMIQNAVQNSEVLTDSQVRAMVKSLIYTVQKQIQQEHDAMEE